MDNSSKIVEDIKWFLYEEGKINSPVTNEFGFKHGTGFISWAGDGHSFFITDGSNKYRLTINKED